MKDPYKEALAEDEFKTMNLLQTFIDTRELEIERLKNVSQFPSHAEAVKAMNEEIRLLKNARRLVSAPPQVGKEWPSDDEIEKAARAAYIYNGHKRFFWKEGATWLKHYMEGK